MTKRDWGTVIILVVFALACWMMGYVSGTYSLVCSQNKESK